MNSEQSVGFKHYKRNWLTLRNIPRKPGEKYLTRFVIFRCSKFGVYIHKFWQSDYAVCHDHPWDFFSIPLTTGYREHFKDGTSIWRGAFSFAFRRAEDFHWVELEKGPAWTFFVHFKKTREWGFLTNDGWVDNDTYTKKLKEEEEKRTCPS